jgi:tetratricopeptide (TPR) repeat protein
VTLAQSDATGVASPQAAFAMRQRLLFSFLILPMLVPWAPALPQTTNSTQQTTSKSKSQSPKWTAADERALLAKAQQGDVSSQMWLACAYEQGWFGKTNIAEALKWFGRSAEQGDPDAQFSMGQMYEDGEGVIQNYALAAEWYRRAAEHVPDLRGAGQGRYHLGLLYLDGHGVPKDYVQAYMWLNLALESNPDLHFAKDHMTPEQIIEAERLVVEWKTRHPMPQGHIRGFVTDSDGRPLPDIFMALQRRDSNFATGFTEIDMKNTGFDGRYDFALIPPGDYLVSANHLGPSPERPYPRFYYGNTESDADATTIHLTASGTVDNIDVTLPIAWKAVTVHARVLQPDGTPAISADVCAYDLNYLYSSGPPSANADTQGRATLSLYEGRTYYLVATISGGTQQRCGGPLKFVARDGVTLRTITIDHNWGNCLAQLDPEFKAPQ